MLYAIPKDEIWVRDDGALKVFAKIWPDGTRTGEHVFRNKEEWERVKKIEDKEFEEAIYAVLEEATRRQPVDIPGSIWELAQVIKALPAGRPLPGLYGTETYRVYPMRASLKAEKFQKYFNRQGVVRRDGPLWEYRYDDRLFQTSYWRFLLRDCIRHERKSRLRTMIEDPTMPTSGHTSPRYPPVLDVPGWNTSKTEEAESGWELLVEEIIERL